MLTGFNLEFHESCFYVKRYLSFSTMMVVVKGNRFRDLLNGGDQSRGGSKKHVHFSLDGDLQVQAAAGSAILEHLGILDAEIMNRDQFIQNLGDLDLVARESFVVNLNAEL